MPAENSHLCVMVPLEKIRPGSQLEVSGSLLGRPAVLISAELLEGGQRVDHAIRFESVDWLEADARNVCAANMGIFEAAAEAGTGAGGGGGDPAGGDPGDPSGEGEGSAVRGFCRSRTQRRFSGARVEIGAGAPRFVRGPGGTTKRKSGHPMIRGLAAVYYDGTPRTEFELFPGLVERIAPGAFERVLADGGDVLALFNHDRNLVLGRKGSGTLSLESTERGLEYAITPGATTIAADVLEHISRRDVTGSSFSFLPLKETWEVDKKRKLDVVTVEDLELFDVGPVTLAAYGATDAEVTEARERAKLLARLTSYRVRANNLES